MRSGDRARTHTGFVNTDSVKLFSNVFGQLFGPQPLFKWFFSFYHAQLSLIINDS